MSRKTGWTKVAFGDVAQLARERSADPESDGFERYVGLEHIDPGDLRIRRWGHVSDGTTFTNVFRAGQVLFGKRRAYQRKVAVADFDGVCSGDIYVFEVPTEITTPDYKLGNDTVPSVSVSAARDKDGKLQYALVNLDPNREAVVTTKLTGAAATAALGRVLTAKTMDARNTVDAPEAIYPVKISAERKGGALVLRLPPKSVSVVRLQ